MPGEVDLVSPGDGQGVDSMSTDGSVPPEGDIANEEMDDVLASAFDMHDELMAEIAANAESAHSVVRHSGARKFNREDPLEAAAAEKILKLKP
jgi:hypothetical protein